MDATRASSSHSQSTSPLTTDAAEGAAPGRFYGECGADRMVKIELEAAEALAGLAHSAMRESESEIPGGDSGLNEWERPSQRVKSESPAVDSVPRSSDLAEDRAAVVQQQCEKTCNVMTKLVKVKQDAELKPSPMCTPSYASSGCNKSRQNLTEAEKEALRLRRVLANRESARQTIRRRQALYEELTRKAADLAWENENLKREKDLATREYDSLKSTNECLKAQMADTVKAEVEETREESKPTQAELSSSPSTNCPFFIFNPPSFMPFVWPPINQSSNSVQLQCGSQNGIAVPSHFPMPATVKPDSFHEQENYMKIEGGPGTPLYILPCPWVYHLPNMNSRLHPPSFDLNDRQNETSLNNQSGASSSSKSIAHVDNHCLSLPLKVKIEASNSTEAIPVNNLHETPFGFPPDGGGQHIAPHPKEMVLMSAPLSCVRPTVTVEHEYSPLPDYTRDVKAISAAVSHIVKALPEKNQEPPSKKLVDAVAAAEARKRRKELKKLKDLHCHRFRMHY